MGRLLSWPHGLAIVERSPLTGPRTVGAASTESITGFVQTSASAFGAWRWQFTVRPMRGVLFRRYRGMVTALHGGANAVRVPFCDPDRISWEEAGVEATYAELHNGVPWSNGLPWSNGENWSVGLPTEEVAVAAALGDSFVTLSGAYWGHALGVGDWLGFDHFGLYVITEVVAQNTGSPATSEYRIWPPLRRALTISSYATLEPVMAMRLEGEAAATATRGRVMAEGNTLTMVEVEDEIVRAYFAE